MKQAITPSQVRVRAEAAHVSINKLMKRAGLPNSTFWRWDLGKTTKPHPVTLRKIADALDAIEAERDL